MRDVRITELAGRQFNRVARWQLDALGLSERAIDRRLVLGELVAVADGVFGVAPVLGHDPWGRWMGATLTAPGSLLSHWSAASAWGILSIRRPFESVTRPGSGGPRRFGPVLAFRSARLQGDSTDLQGVPITTPERTLLDLATKTSDRALARGVREAVRLGLTSTYELATFHGTHRGRRGIARLGLILERYSGIPIARARSGAEVRAMELFKEAGRPLPGLNIRIAGKEADLSWPRYRLIVEIDGGPFHLDAGEDARKQAAWEAAGWQVCRVPADLVYDDPGAFLRVAPDDERPDSHP